MEEIWGEKVRDPKSGHEFLWNEDLNAVLLDHGSICGGHRDDALCRKCLPDAEALLAAARRQLDPDAAPFVSEARVPVDFPEKLALWNPFAKNAFGMRRDFSRRIMSEKTVHTGGPKGPPVLKVDVLDWTCKGFVSDASYLRAFSFRLLGDPPDAWVRRFWDAKLTFMLDGEAVVKDRRVQDLIGMKECAFPRVTDCCLLDAVALGKEDKADPSQWLGFMCPNGTRFEAHLEGVPAGGGRVQVETSFDLANYTTRRAQGQDGGASFRTEKA